MTIMALFTISHAQEIHVSNARDFLLSIGSNKTIIIEDEACFNLTEALLGIHETLPNEYPMFEEDDDEAYHIQLIKNTVSFINQFDGPEIVIKDITNLIVKGGDRLPVLLAQPRYAYIFRLYNCSNITFENLIMGHTNEGGCIGGVVELDQCNKISFINCDLFGCGTEGLTAKNVNDLTFNNSHIHDCTSSIMSLYDCNNCSFNNSLFFNNREYELVNITGTYTKNIHFTNCEFFQNNGTLFNFHNSILFENCYISHPKDKRGTTKLIYDLGSKWTVPTGYPHE